MLLRGPGGDKILDFYVSDVAAASVTFSDGVNAAGASSPKEYTVNGPCVLADVSIATGLVDTTAAVFVKNGTSTSNVLRWANFVNTLTNRITPRITFNAGDRISLTQLA